MSLTNYRDGVVTAEDAGGNAASFAPSEGAGITLDNLQPDNLEAEMIYSRGEVVGMVHTQRSQVTGSITLIHQGALSASGSNKPWDAVLKTGAYSGNATADPDGAVWTLDKLELVTTQSDGTVDTHTLRNVRANISYAESETVNTVTINFTAFGGTDGTPAPYSHAST